LWMDWPEDHWGLTDTEYEILPREERAQLEAREQVQRWVALEFYQEWLVAYCPATYDLKWWDGGWSKMTLKKREKLAKVLAEKIRLDGESK
ncbi:hypothetical protein LCGC14_3154870, partial [marine sediment metagenome]